MWWALLGALLAALAYGSATVLQAMSVRGDDLGVAPAPGEPSHTGRSRAAATRLYALGLALDGVGFLASLAALRRLPLFLVESAVAASVAVTAVLTVLVFGVRLGRSEVAALLVTFAGLVLLAVSARDKSAQSVGSAAGWLVLASAGAVGLLFLVGLRLKDDNTAAVVLAVTSGTGFGILGIAARVVQIRVPWWHTAADPMLWAIAAHGGLAAVAYGFALHRGRTTTVAAVTIVVETVLPAAIGLSLLGDGVRPHLGAVAGAGFVAAVAGSLVLARHAEGDTASEPNPVGDRRSAV